MSSYILVANAGEASLYTIDNLRVGELERVKTFDHPESRQKWSEQVTDKRGRYQTDHGARSAYEKYDPKEAEAESFAKELVDELSALGIKNEEVDSVIFVAPPDFQGILRKLVDEKDFPRILDITKDYTYLKPDELILRIREQIFV